MADETLIALTADIVSAHVSGNVVTAGQLPELIAAVYASLAGLGAPELVIEPKLEPAVSIRSSVKPDSVTCLECGQKLKMIKRHLGSEHGLTPAEYKARWGLGADYPLVAPEYAARRKELALAIGLGRKPVQKAKAGRKPRVAKVAGSDAE